MKHYTIIAILLGVFCIPLNGEDTCPTGKPRGLVCNNKSPCPAGSRCYRSNSEPFCCGELDAFCPTKMHTFSLVDAQGAYLYIKGVATNMSSWYEVKAAGGTIICPRPFSYTYINKLEVYPVDFDAAKMEASKPKACNLNSDCKEGEFCGEANNPSFAEEFLIDIGLDMSGNKNGQAVPLSFCYKFQDYGNPKVKGFIKKDVKGLIACNTNTDCKTAHGDETFCFKKSDIKINYLEGGKPAKKAGVCAEAHICEDKAYERVQGALPRKDGVCGKDSDCESVGVSKNGSGEYESQCLDLPALETPESHLRMCCFKHLKACIVGTAASPAQTCANFMDCNKDQNTTNSLTMNKWCDESGKHCCRDRMNILWLCPDGATPLFNEPACDGYNAADTTSGTCPNKEGTCRYGHCCPPLKSVDGKGFLGKKPYQTNFDCQPDAPLPQPFQFAFCDPDKKKIVVLGERHTSGEAIVKTDKKCTLTSECSKGHVCATETLGERFCYFNPLKKLKEEASQFWLYALIASLVCSCVFMCTSIICLVCYRSKSVFDKYVPKKKKKKGTSTSKASKASKTSSKATKGSSSKKTGTTGNDTSTGNDGTATDSAMKQP